MELTNLIQEPELQEIAFEDFNTSGVKLFVLRLDKMHPWAGGNKYFKLIENLKIFREQNWEGILSFGGAYSNHLTALAWVCSEQKIPLTLMVRGEETLPLNPRINAIRNLGANIVYMSREAYRRKEDPAFLKELKAAQPGYYLIQEGGKNEAGIRGCEGIADYIPQNIQHVFLPVGTAVTITGIAAGLNSNQKLWGVSVLKGISGQEEILHQNVTEIFNRKVQCEIEILTDFHFGGYAKIPAELFAFQKQMEEKIPGICFEGIYVAKAFAGLYAQVKAGKIKKGESIVFIHTGGQFPCDKIV